MLLPTLLCCAQTFLSPTPTAAATAAPRLLVDQTDDGTIWVRGNDYKLSLTSAGARFRVRTGPARPTEAFELAPPAAFAGARALAVAADAEPVLHGRTVTYARGDLVEVWTLEPAGARQNFLLLAPPPAGDLLLRIPHSGELAPVAAAGPLAFRGAGGSEVRYGDWFAVDPLGRSAAGRPTADASAIEIRVPDAFLRAAQYPLWIDPLVSVTTVVSSTHDVSDAELANDDSLGIVTTCYTDTFSKGDQDIVATRVNESGVFLSELPIEISDESTDHPSIANHESANQFLVAWTDVGDEPYELFRIRARTIQASSGALGSIWSVHAGDGASFPAVGGSSSSSTSANYYVVWNEYGLIPLVDPDVAGRTVSPSGSMGSRSLLDGRSSEQSVARISKRSGNGNRWMVVYTTALANGVSSVDCAVVNTSGTVLLDKHSLTNSVASVPDVDGDGTEFLTVFQGDDANGVGNIFGMRSTFSGSSLSTVGYALSFVELSQAQLALDQRQPVVARTKSGFTYAYSEASSPNSGANAVFAASIHQNATPLTFTEKRVALGSGGAAKICNGLLDKRCFVLWQGFGVGTDELDMAVYDAP